MIVTTIEMCLACTQKGNPMVRFDCYPRWGRHKNIERLCYQLSSDPAALTANQLLLGQLSSGYLVRWLSSWLAGWLAGWRLFSKQIRTALVGVAQWSLRAKNKTKWNKISVKRLRGDKRAIQRQQLENLAQNISQRHKKETNKFSYSHDSWSQTPSKRRVLDRGIEMYECLSKW